MQDDNTGMMIRTVADLVSFVSSRVQFEPGETVEVEIEELGTLLILPAVNL